jgi:hypothetical protein
VAAGAVHVPRRGAVSDLVRFVLVTLLVAELAIAVGLAVT